jgi:hypothetical protein
MRGFPPSESRPREDSSGDHLRFPNGPPVTSGALEASAIVTMADPVPTSALGSMRTVAWLAASRKRLTVTRENPFKGDPSTPTTLSGYYDLSVTEVEGLVNTLPRGRVERGCDQ